jgi:DNA-binding XRE family transcriptional regulator/tetratricopeptide (TPR) repeat protein
MATGPERKRGGSATETWHSAGLTWDNASTAATVLPSLVTGGGRLVARRRRTRLATARKAAGYTQEALAAALHVDRSTVIRWEAGRHAPLPYLWPKLTSVLRLRREQLQLLLVDDHSPPGPAAQVAVADQALTLDDMRRRTLFKWGLATTATAGLGVSSGTTVGMVEVKRLAGAAARLHSLDQQHGGDSLWQAALAQANEGIQLLERGSYTDAVAQQLLTATGRLQICAGWLAFDAGQHVIAHTCFTDALAISRQANDAQIETRALANLAMQSNTLSRPREAMRYAVGAEHAANTLARSSWLAAIPQLRLAVSSARMGNARGADNAIAHARRVLEQNNDTSDEEWSSFLTPLELDAVEASCAIRLRRLSRAERLLEHAIAGYAKNCARNLAIYRVRLARTRLDMGAADGAVEVLHHTLDDLSAQVASWRVTSELDTVAKRLAACPTVDGVEGFLDRYEGIGR